MDNQHPERPRRRLRLRGMMVLVAVIAVGLSVIVPRFSNEIGWLERYVRIKLNQDDMNRHANLGHVQRLAREFAAAVQVGRSEEALEMTSTAFRSHTPWRASALCPAKSG